MDRVGVEPTTSASASDSAIAGDMLHALFIHFLLSAFFFNISSNDNFPVVPYTIMPIP
jgi:hypothetical protein